jgi:hypothetical protein
MARLPVPGSDGGTWGDILNTFLLAEHNADGTLKTSGSLAAKADDSTVVKLSGNQTVSGVKTFASSPIVPTPSSASEAATKDYVDTVATSGAPDADAFTKGIVQLAGDLSGTAASPQIAAGVIVDADINASAAIAQSKVANLTTDLSNKASSTDLTSHTSDTTNVHGIVDTADLLSAADIADVVETTDTDASGFGFVVDEDAMTSNSSLVLPTQQSVKAYVDALEASVASDLSGKANASDLTAHASDTTSVHGIADTADLLSAADIANVVETTDVDASAFGFVVDEDAMTSNSSLKLPTQQSVKAYVDALDASVGSSISSAISALAAVASTGSYDDLIDVPIIPSSLNATKASDTGFTSATAADDPELLLDLAVGVWDFELHVLYDGTTANDARVGLNFGGTATIVASGLAVRQAADAGGGGTGWEGDSGTHQVVSYFDFGSTINMGAGGVGAWLPFRLSGRINVTVAGTLQTRCAKNANTDTGTDTILKTGSYLSAIEVVTTP